MFFGLHTDLIQQPIKGPFHAHLLFSTYCWGISLEVVWFFYGWPETKSISITFTSEAHAMLHGW